MLASRDTQNGLLRNREVQYEHSVCLPELLGSLQASLMITTYQAGKLVVLGEHNQKLSLSFHNFERPMGIAIDDACNEMAVATSDKVWRLHNTRSVASQLEGDGQYDACFLARSACITGEIQAHEMAWAGDELWVVNTLFSCLATLHPRYSFVPRWQPRFVSALVAEDRCHLNGMAVVDDRVKFVTVMGETNTAGGWRERKAEAGCLIDVDSGETVVRGFAMPHSPRWHDGCIWLLDSGRGGLVRIDPRSRSVDTVARLPGYTRGLAIYDSWAFVGLSRIRETSTFGGVPIAERRDQLKCGVGVVDLRTGALVSQFEFQTGVEEIFDVTLVPQVRQMAVRGPYSAEDGTNAIWTVPGLEDQVSQRAL